MKHRGAHPRKPAEASRDPLSHFPVSGGGKADSNPVRFILVACAATRSGLQLEGRESGAEKEEKGRRRPNEDILLGPCNNQAITMSDAQSEGRSSCTAKLTQRLRNQRVVAAMVCNAVCD